MLKCWNQDSSQTSKEWGAANSSEVDLSYFRSHLMLGLLLLSASPGCSLSMALRERGWSKQYWSNIFLQAIAFLPTWSAYQERDTVHYFVLLQLLTVTGTSPRSHGVCFALFHICLETTVTTVDRNRSWGADILTGVSEPQGSITYCQLCAVFHMIKWNIFKQH